MPDGGEWVALVAVIMGTLSFLIPIAGFTARFALKPIAEAVAKIKGSQGAGQHIALLEQRVALLEQQQANTDSEVQQLLEVQRFQEQLMEKPAIED